MAQADCPLLRETLLVVICLLSVLAEGQSKPSSSSATCRVDAVEYKGWHAQQMSNQWVQLTFIPQNGGRLIQFAFNGHPYLFVNPKYAGKYFPPSSKQWFNYGGDKLWLLPEGNDDEQHWVGNSDLIDDGQFTFRKISDGQHCEIELTGPADPQTGVRFSRTVHLDAASPNVRFHSTMKNVTGHSLEWSMQSVSQYDTSDLAAQSRINPNFWAFTPANPSSSYLNRYHVRYGPAQNSSVSVRDDGLFAVHYAHMAAELWLDSDAGWLAVLDGATKYSMVERFQFQESKPYPGKASVIFWTNGSGLQLNSDGEPVLRADEEGKPPFYMEAELNSPLCRLRPGESCDFDTEWFPTRAEGELHGVMDAGILVKPLHATRIDDGKISMTGSFGVFFPGQLLLRLYDKQGANLGTIPGADVSPTELVTLQTEISANAQVSRVSLHLVDTNGVDRGSLGEIPVSATEKLK
ncbi:MAG TPA: hypothetical protein VJQ54_00995 [Candidatus Sulfotelmatobacter sp.]|nr:hypothetical protein [Candidatus Sulfotelmatobacter sp.]